jgi:glycosyltransferase involved in cell wall biosynthesis
MKIKYAGPARDYSGYGEANRHDIAALDKAGIMITTQIPSYTLEISDYGRLGEIATLAEGRLLAYNTKIIHTTPNVYRQFMEPGKYHIGRIFWETDKLPLDFAAPAQMMDEIWTGSRYNANAIRNAGVTKPIYIIPEAIDTEIDFGSIQPYEMPDVDPAAFKFYSIFEWTERKNPLALLEAYWREFEGVTDVCLILKTYVDNFTPDRKQEIDQAIRLLKKRLPLTHFAPIKLYRGLMDRHQIYRFHKSFDVFVSAHRGEGWGIPQMEALLMGRPIISTNAGGIHEYLINKIHGLLVPYEMVGITENTRNRQWYTQDQRWAEIDLQSLRAAFHYAYEHKAEMAEMGIRGQNLVKTLFSLEAVGKKMKERLEAIANDPYKVDRIDEHPNLRVGDIIEPEQVIEVPDPNGLGKGSKYTIPPLVKKNRIRVDYNAIPENVDET